MQGRLPHQLVTGFRSEVRIEREHLNREGDFVLDRLTGAVAAGEQPNVLRSIVGSLPVQVVDSFFGSEFSAEALFHHKAMFKNLATANSALVGESEADVSLCRDASLNLSRFFGSASRMLCKFVGASTLRTAKTALSVDGSSGFSLDGHPVAALDAVDLPLLVRQSASFATTRSRTILGFFAELFHVGTDAAWEPYERVTARLARELDRLRSVMKGVKAVLLLITPVAGSAAELL